MLLTYQGYDIFAPEIAKPANISITNKFVTVGSMHTAREVIVNKETNQSFTLTVFQSTFDERKALKDFFISKQGKLNPFWYFNPAPVGRLLQDEIIGSTTILLPNSSMLFKFTTQEIHLYIQSIDVVVKVIGVSNAFSNALGKYQVLELFAPLEVNISKESLVHMLSFVRFDQDTLSIDYDTHKTSASKIKFKELQADLKTLGL